MSCSRRRPPTWFLFAHCSAEGSSQYICAWSHLYLFYLEKTNMTIANCLALEEIIIPPNAVLFIHGYMQHAVPRWRGTYDLQYHIEFLPMQMFKRIQARFLMYLASFPTSSQSEGHIICLCALVFIWY